MRGLKNGICVVCACLALCPVFTFPIFADEWVLDEIYLENSDSETDLHDNGQDTLLSIWDIYGYDYIPDEDEEMLYLSSPSNATPSNINLYANYGGVYDGSMSGTYITYAKDTISRLPYGVHYVFFRPSQYEYRLVYGKELVQDGGIFYGENLEYISYNSRYYTITSGDEGSFRLTTNGYLVYTDLLGIYPALDSGVRRYEFVALLFCSVLSLVVTLVKSFFSPGKFTV